MKRFLTIAMMILFAGSSKASELRICGYDPDQVMAQSEERKSMVAELDEGFKQLFDAIKNEEESLRKALTDFQSKTALLSETARENEQTSLMRKKRDLDAKAERALEDYKMERQKLEMRFVQSLETHVAGFAKEKAFDVVLPKITGIYVSAGRADKTTEIIEYMNKQHKNSSSTKKSFVS